MEDYNKKTLKELIVILIIFLLFVFYQKNSFDQTVLRNVEMIPFSVPVQKSIKDGKQFKHITKEGVANVTPIATYKIYGRVADIHFRPAKLPLAAMYPYDVTIAYGNFKHKEVFENVKFRMVATVVYWQYSHNAWQNHLSKYYNSFSDFKKEITNNHICPANANIVKGLKKLKKEDVVYLEGYLIKFNLKTKDGVVERGISSTSRDDSFGGDNGNGNCEQIYVTRVVSRHGDFR